MGKRGNRFALCLVVVLLATAAVGPRAEISADTPQGVLLLMLGLITEGPDPIPQVIWDPVRDVDPSLFLNPDGGARGDGRPDAAFHPDTNWPHVVWAFSAGSDRDIAYSAWIGTEWSDTEFLTSTVSDDIDPRVYISDVGTAYVVWWDANLERVWMSALLLGISTWGDPEQVTGALDTGRRPSILEWEGEVLAAYERDSTGLGQDIVVATRVSEAVFTTEIVSTSSSQTPLNVMLHNEGGVLWADWRHSDSEYAYSVYANGAWGSPVTLSWIAESWTQAEEVRQVIRGVVLSD